HNILVDSACERVCCASKILLICAVIVESADADGSMVSRARWTSRLDSVTAFRIAFEVELVVGAKINIFRISSHEGCCAAVCGIRAIGVGNGPIKVTVVRVAAEFNSPLWRAQDKWVIRCLALRDRHRGRGWGAACWPLRYSGFTEYVVAGKIRRPRLRKGKVEFKLPEPHVQEIRRQVKDVAEVVVFQVSVSQPTIRAGSSRGNIVVNPEREIRPKTSRADDRERVRNKKVGARNISSGGHNRRGLLRVPVEVAFVTKGDGQCARDLTGIDCFGELFFLRFGAEQDGILFHEYVIVLGKLEAVLLERLTKVVQLRIVVVASRA